MESTETEAIDKVVWQQILTILQAENGQIQWRILRPFLLAFLTGGETRGEAKMGFSAFGKAKKRHCSGVQRRLCPFYHWQKTCHVRFVKSRSKGQDATNRLFTPSR